MDTPGGGFMLRIGFFRSFRLKYILLVAGVCAGQAQQIYPAAMSSAYNPLLWRGDDARFALDVLHASYCTAAVSKTVVARTQNDAIQIVALKIAQEQHKVYRQLRTMAQTFSFPLPPKRDLNDCRGGPRIAELSGRELDASYVDFVLKRTAANVSQFEAEAAMPRVPSNWTLWKFARKNLPMIRDEEAIIKAAQRRLAKDQ
jgi:predicted outer membrane protein